ncbi:MAG: cytidine deaminase [Deltaproteobacteria bacterium GWC2_42_11]|nr:MAG: cytidine deaminase [Deltaproteobacteria bacterium GWC2_42_11]HBO84022.1 cytidine deaminase [Deltaproteobacteria bacterium]
MKNRGAKTGNRGLVKVAMGAMTNAVADFSGFKVGAAILAGDGRIFTGCNIENPSLMLTICAERVALLKALSEGATDFERIAISASKNPCYPCGSCRQMLFEFAKGIKVITVNPKGSMKSTGIDKLLPMTFRYKKGG